MSTYPRGRLGRRLRSIPGRPASRARGCDPTCAPHLHQHCSSECEWTCTACSARLARNDREAAIRRIADLILVVEVRALGCTRFLERAIGRKTAEELVDVVLSPASEGGDDRG